MYECKHVSIYVKSICMYLCFCVCMLACVHEWKGRESAPSCMPVRMGRAAPSDQSVPPPPLASRRAPSAASPFLNPRKDPHTLN